MKLDHWTPQRDVTVLLAHPSPDLYGSDLQLLVTSEVLIEGGYHVVAALPTHGPLLARLERIGVEVEVLPFPALRKAHLKPSRLLRLIGSCVPAVVRASRMLRERRADVLLVNTLTLPTWLLSGALSRASVVAHVHEAEEDQPRLFRTLLAAQLVLSEAVVVNSAAARRALCDVLPFLTAKIEIVHNGVPEPKTAVAPMRRRAPNDSLRLALVGRLSPRKGIDVALEAVAKLRSSGNDVTIDICGTVFPGYEWYEAGLRARAGEADLVGAVKFHGYVSPTWQILERADAVLVPSRVEPFGNAAVEAMHAGRPLVASAVQGLTEVVSHEKTGLQVAPGDPDSLAGAIARLMNDPDLARHLASEGQIEAHRRFSQQNYGERVIRTIESTRRVRQALWSRSGGRV